ncbi:hypothetical protein PAHAL_5G370400 [Panicum hallii]|uniref:Endonuclease/exonuclease/phosphatase domain-containing protein n=1 Tax=Panicum hallii TaxID=206008 RepID=A0A2T8IMF0_9POAL|nr:hypothetical protein PAHAL_5G370400 [Panicum hallii]
MKPIRNLLGRNPLSDALHRNPGILIDKSLKDGVVDVRRQGDRIILVRLVIGDLVLNVISAYAPQVGLSESSKSQFWEDLDSMVSTVPISEKLFIGGDLNSHVGATNVGYERVHGGFGYGSRNEGGGSNTLFRKRESHLVTFHKDRRACLDCKVIPGECVVPQHKLVVADFVFGGGKQEVKESWWWNDEVQRAIKEKECFKRLHLDKSATNIEGYRLAKRSAKRAVSVAKGQAFDDLYQRLGTKEGEKDIYRIARTRERKTRDINQIKCIKDGTDRLLVKDEEIKDRWREYFDKLFNGENEGPTFELDDSFDDTNRCFVRRIQEAEIGEALKRMKGGKAMGPDGIPIEVWRCLGERAVVWLTKLFNLIFRSNKMPEEWRRSRCSKLY